MPKDKQLRQKKAAVTTTLSLRLLRTDKKVEQAIRDASTVVEVDSDSGRLFTAQAPGTAPTWLTVVNQFAKQGDLKLENKSCAAVLFLNVQPDDKRLRTRTFALTFGSGHHALDPDAFVRNFGLKVTLNSVARGALRNLDIATLDSTTIQKRIQASRKADLQGFGIDLQNDLLRLAGGVPTDTAFANAIAGRDGLTLTSKLSASEIPEKCRMALRLFNANDYKKDYSFIDQIVPVQDKKTLADLDEIIFKEINTLLEGKPSDLHITLPEIIDPEKSGDFGYFGIGFNSGLKRSYGELAIEDYISELKSGRPQEISGIAELKASHDIRIVTDGQGDRRRRRRVYDCFVYEVNYKKQTYVLFSGEWYCIESNFFQAVEKDYRALLGNSFLASSTAKNEQELIAELDSNIDLLNLDKVKASPLGATGANLEPCDFLSRRKEFIHLKDGHGSAPISHLWNQGLVSAESFIRDEVFRKSIRRSAIERQKSAGKSKFELLLPSGRSKVAPTDYKVVFGIMRHPYQRSQQLGLPFFSKVSLRAVASRIQLMGYSVEVHLIEKK
ncbi:TIGR04141 family sporadically distributed protein [Alcaligenaceae bacterium B3P038]|nr:TIGR04141 family sporadically distributed protein [Alcaligenaceae bacterium B3P038]